MTDTLAITVYSSCLTITLAIAGAIASSWGAPQAAALFVAAGCAALSSVAAALILSRANAAQANARTRYAEQYGENPQDKLSGAPSRVNRA